MCSRVIHGMLDYMKVLILYKPKSEHGTSVEAYVHDFSKRHETDHLEAIDADSVDGSVLAQLYDVVQYPTVLALDENGTLLNQWTGDSLPLMDEVAYYSQ